MSNTVDLLPLFCLTAKVRQAQKAYFKAKKKKADNADELLLSSIRLENVLDAYIKKLLPSFPVEELKNTWVNFLNRDMKEIELEFGKTELNK